MIYYEYSQEYTSGVDYIIKAQQAIRQQIIALESPDVQINANCELVYKYIQELFERGDFSQLVNLIQSIAPSDDYIHLLRAHLQDTPQSTNTLDGVWIFTNEGEYLGFGQVDLWSRQTRFFTSYGELIGPYNLSLADSRFNVAILNLQKGLLPANTVSMIKEPEHKIEALGIPNRLALIDQLIWYEQIYRIIYNMGYKSLRKAGISIIRPSEKFIESFGRFKLYLEPVRNVQEDMLDVEKMSGIYFVKLSAHEYKYEFMGLGSINFENETGEYITPEGEIISLPLVNYALYMEYNLAVIN